MSEPRTVLLGWELGGGLGHVRQLLELARGLAAAGLRPVLALKALAEAGALLRDAPFPALQAPLFPPRTGPGFLARSYADVLAAQAFDDADELSYRVRAWQDLLDLVRPAVVVCDHSPTLCLTALGAVPVVLVGSGFAVPPDRADFPVLMPGRPALAAPEKLLAAVREVQTRRRRPPPPTLPGLFAGAECFATVLPHLDVYRETRRRPAVGPLWPVPPPRPPAPAPWVFAYLSTETPGTEAILTCLGRCGVPVRAYVRGADDGLRERSGAGGVEVLPLPLGQDAMLGAAVLVHHGGVGLSQAALAAGRPQLLFPTNLEQALTAQRLHALGVAHYLTAEFPARDVGEGLRQLLTRPAFLSRARELADDVHAGGPWEALSAVVACCRRLAPGD
jgi:UDP:flavonoid glycosyltransferase YjiC (YdhE family)